MESLGKALSDAIQAGADQGRVGKAMADILKAVSNKNADGADLLTRWALAAKSGDIDFLARWRAALEGEKKAGRRFPSPSWPSSDARRPMR